MPSAEDQPLPARPDAKGSTNGRPLPAAADRALAEAAARRTERGEAAKSQAAREVDGRGGLDPTRYGDWEVNGLASDF